MTKSWSLTPLLNPRSIAIVGASPQARFALQLISNAEMVGFNGPIYPVNPKYQEVGGRACFASLAALPEVPDCVVVIVPAEGVLGVIEEAGRLGVGSAIVVAQGFSDATTEKGRGRQAELVGLAQTYGIAIAGPNCLGIASMAYSFANTYANIPTGMVPGGISIVSQSGGLMLAAAAYATTREAGLNYLISGGNQAVVEMADYIAHLGDDPRTTVITCIMEGAKNGRRLRAALEGAARKKPVVVLKLGRSESGQRATLAHTGTLAGEDGAYATLFRQNGVAQVNSIDELMETAILFSQSRLPQGDGVAMFTISGGGTSLIGDLGEAAGLSYQIYGAETQARLQQILDVDRTLNNPMDTTGWPQLLKEGNLGKVLDTLLADPAIDLVAAAFRVTDQHKLLAEMEAKARQSSKPIVMISFTSYSVPEAKASAKTYPDLPVLEDLEGGLRAVRHLIDYGLYRKRLLDNREAPSAAARREIRLSTGRQTLTEFESKVVLAGAGLPITRERLAKTEAEAADAAASIGGAVALKIQSPDLPHKSDVGGVVLGVKGPDDARAAYRRIVAAAKKARPDAAIDGVLVQEMVADGVEMILGMKLDEQLGPIIVCGMGGIFVELMKDVALRFPPLGRPEARRMLGDLKGAPLLGGYRGRPAADIDALVEALVAFGDFVVQTEGKIAAIDINPLMVRPMGQGVTIADALIVPVVAAS